MMKTTKKKIMSIKLRIALQMKRGPYHLMTWIYMKSQRAINIIWRMEMMPNQKLKNLKKANSQLVIHTMSWGERVRSIEESR